MSRVRCWPSTEASTQRGWACPPCAWGTDRHNQTRAGFRFAKGELPEELSETLFALIFERRSIKQTKHFFGHISGLVHWNWIMKLIGK